MFKSEPKNIDGIYVSSVPANATLYNQLWQDRINKIPKNSTMDGASGALNDFLLNKTDILKDQVVLELCAGLGRISLACFKAGAKTVVMCDGSSVGPTHAKNIKDKSFADKDFIPVQLDMEKLHECFEDNAFGVVMLRYALQHLKDHHYVISELYRITKPGGIFVFNYFNKGTNSPTLDEFREFTLSCKPEDVTQFLIDFGYHNDSKKFDFGAVTKTSSEHYPESYRHIIDHVKKLINKRGYENMKNTLHFESLLTPYIHNFNDAEVLTYTKSLGTQIIHSQQGHIIAKKTVKE